MILGGGDLSSFVIVAGCVVVFTTVAWPVVVLVACVSVLMGAVGKVCPSGNKYVVDVATSQNVI